MIEASGGSPPLYRATAEDAADLLEVDVQRGLEADAVGERRTRHGFNEIAAGRGRSLPLLLLSQFTDVLVLVLIVAAGVSFAVGEPIDSAVILTIVFLNAAIGCLQEYRAERAIAALRSMVAPEARVRRGGEECRIAARDVVPGDVLLLEAGEVVPADARLVEATGLETDESALTGESQTVSKTPEVVPNEVPAADQRNMTFKGTLVTRGKAVALVGAIGAETELGRIAQLLRRERVAETPLQQRLRRFGGRLTFAICVVCLILFLAGLFRGEPAGLMFLTAVSLAVAAVPEALPAVVTMSLAVGARMMSRAQSLIRRLPAVETLGSVTTICADKTGTLTRNEMSVERLWNGVEQIDRFPTWSECPSAWRSFLLGASLNSDAETGPDGDKGDPTEVALQRAATDAGASLQGLGDAWPRRAEVPFDSVRKRMTTVHEGPEGWLALTKGAPEAVVPLCTKRETKSGPVDLDPAPVLEEAEAWARAGYRVLAFAVRREAVSGDDAEIECDLTFVGLAGLIDPPRDEVPDAVRACQEAGITPVMITGDHPGTALAIANRLGIADAEEQVLTGADLKRYGAPELKKAVGHTRVFARVTPEQKIQIVEALQSRGEFAAMTGDGVNDAPALKRADIGVAMGLKGTDVAREAADMVLLDDNFATIVRAVAEGRRIFSNIRKFISYTMTSNAGEIATLFFAPFMGLPIPLLPSHILWINLVTDGLPGLALAVEPQEPGTMSRRPRPPRESIFAGGLWQHMIWVGLFIGALSLGMQAWAYHGGNERWQTMVFTVLTVSQLFNALAVRSETESLFRMGIFGNVALIGAIALTMILQLGVIYLPFMNTIFHTQPLTLYELLICIALSSTTLFVIEIEKWLIRRGWLFRSGRFS